MTSIGESAFANCSSLTGVVIPDSVTNIGAYAFKDCHKLTIFCEAAEKPDGWNNSWNGSCPVIWDYNNNEKDENGCEYAVIDGIRYSLKEGVATVAVQLNDVTTANIPSFVVYNGETYNVTSIGDYAFYNCSLLESVTIPYGVTDIGYSAFSGCSLLESVTIPYGVVNIWSDAFRNCCSIESITIPNSVKFITASAFSGCSALTSIELPNSVTQIINGTFYGCSSLERITIPNTVTSIGIRVFSDCSVLTDINFNGTEAQWNAIEKDSSWDYNTGDYTVHCTDGDIAKANS